MSLSLPVRVLCASLALASIGAAQCPHTSTYTGFHEESVGGLIVSDGDEALFGGGDPSSGFFKLAENDFWTRTALLGSGQPSTPTVAGSCDFRGDLLVMGSPSSNTLGTSPGPHGAAFVFERGPGNWAATVDIFPPNPASSGGFGSAVAIADDGARIFVGANANFGTGPAAVHVYSRLGAGWAFESTIPEPAIPGTLLFGSQIAHVAGRLFVSAPGTFLEQNDIEQVFVFEEVAGVWTLVTTLSLGIPGYQGFGATLVGDGTRVAMSASRFQLPGSLDFGAVAIFDFAQPNWEATPQLIFAPSEQAPASFGAALDMRGSRLVVSSNASVFEYVESAADWQLVSAIRERPEDAYFAFGRAVALTENGFLVGSPSHDPNEGAYPNSTGGVYYYDTRDRGQSFRACGSAHVLNAQSRVELRLEWPQMAGSPYRIFGSVTGVGPTLVNGVSVPLVPDAYTALLQSFSGAPVFLPGGVGMLDASGRASMAIELPAGLPLALDGLAVHHAAIAFPATGSFAVTNSITTTLVAL